jgi:hypothetical protein
MDSIFYMLIHVQVIGPAYSKNPFFGIERTKEWVLPAPFATYMQAVMKVFSSVYFTQTQCSCNTGDSRTRFAGTST